MNDHERPIAGEPTESTPTGGEQPSSARPGLSLRTLAAASVLCVAVSAGGTAALAAMSDDGSGARVGPGGSPAGPRAPGMQGGTVQSPTPATAPRDDPDT